MGEEQRTERGGEDREERKQGTLERKHGLRRRVNAGYESEAVGDVSLVKVDCSADNGNYSSRDDVEESLSLSVRIAIQEDYFS